MIDDRARCPKCNHPCVLAEAPVLVEVLATPERAGRVYSWGHDTPAALMLAKDGWATCNNGHCDWTGTVAEARKEADA